MATRNKRLYCREPDCDVPELVCGCPLPCPQHTATIDTTTQPPEVRIPIVPFRAFRPGIGRVLKDIGQAIVEDNERRETIA